MATAVLRLDTRSKKTDVYPIVIRLTHKNLPKMMPTGYKATVDQWDKKNLKVRKGYQNSTRVNAQIGNQLALANDIILRYDYQLKDMTVYELADLVKESINGSRQEKKEVISLKKSTTLSDYGRKVITMYNQSGQYSMAEGFEYAINSMVNYSGRINLLLTDIDEIFLLGYEANCRSKGMKVNAFGAYLRSIRRIYNLAIKDSTTEVSKEHYPFGQGGYSIKKAKTKKRAIKTDYLQVIRDLDYQHDTPIWHHRNYLLFMFNCRGMNFIDLAFLNRENVSEGRLKYRRRKTRRGESVKDFNIKLNEEALGILKYYLNQRRTGNLIFPILQDVIDSDDESYIYKKYTERRSTHNDWLKKIGKDAGIPVTLTTYVIRHTFATAGLHKGVGKNVIGDMLGHTNYYTTEAYFDDFDKEVLDDAADQILS
ncbi:site-specific integrase [Fulvivirga sp. 29W222]|uniref:Site-specific integrase n=1 Tax=Fulvivirga marina TaxID=2494733 RepID=A0A937FWP6_9BACT|nr:tyrosine-type recombinase/integrase [Fulvivirga marina]MBL6445746.1 site-specific integrase [Fulvivirga marina]